MTDASDDRFVWGAEAIAEVIGCTPKAAYYLFESGALAGAVKKVRRRLVGHVGRLKATLIAEVAA